MQKAIKLKNALRIVEFVIVLALIETSLVSSTSPVYLQNGNITATGTISATNVTASNYYLGNQTLGFIQPATFIIDQSGSYARMWYGANSTLAFNSTNGLAVLQSAVDNLTSGGRIIVKSGFSSSGELVVTQSNIQIEGESRVINIGRLLINSTSAPVTDDTFINLGVTMITFYAKSNPISTITFDSDIVTAAATTTSEGIVFTGEDTGETHTIWFNKCYFYDGGQSARKGFFSWTTRNNGNGQIYLMDCVTSVYHGGSEGCLFAVEENATVGPPIQAGHLNFVISSGPAMYYVVRVYADKLNGGIQTGCSVDIGDYSLFELHGNTTFVRSETSSNPQRVIVSIHNNDISFIDSTNYLVYDGSYSSYKHYAIKDNYMIGNLPAIGTLKPSTDLPLYEYYSLRVEDNVLLNPIGIIANPFMAYFGANLIGLGGDSASPTANTVYPAVGCDLQITCSGGTGVNITVTDKDNNALFTNASTLTNYELCNGWTITFGNFSVAPTVQVAGQ